jgi:hypothetical protein
MHADPLAYTPLFVALTLLLNAFFPLLKSAPLPPQFPSAATRR